MFANITVAGPHLYIADILAAAAAVDSLAEVGSLAAEVPVGSLAVAGMAGWVEHSALEGAAGIPAQVGQGIVRCRSLGLGMSSGKSSNSANGIIPDTRASDGAARKDERGIGKAGWWVKSTYQTPWWEKLTEEEYATLRGNNRVSALAMSITSSSVADYSFPHVPPPPPLILA